MSGRQPLATVSSTKLIRSRALIAVAALVAGGLVTLVTAHLPPVQAWIGRAALRWLAPRMGVVATAESLSYNLLTLDVRLGGVTAAAEGWNDRPFLTADEIRVDVPWRVLAGAAAVQSIELTGATISIVRAQDGRLNLPTSDGGGAGSISRVEVGRAIIRQTDLRYADLSNDLTVSVDGIALEMAPAGAGTIQGRLTTVSGPAVRAGDVAVDGSLAGRLSYDGSSLGVAELVFASDVARIQADGRLNTLWSAPVAALGLTGTLSLAELSSRLRLTDPVSGSMGLKASVNGPLNAPRVPFALTSDAFTWRHLQASAFAADGTLDTDAVQINTSTAQVSGGTVTTRGELRFTPLRTTATAEWRGVSARSLVGPSAPVDVAAVLSGRATADWLVASGMPGLAATIDVEAEADGSGGPRAIGVSGSIELDVDNGRWSLRLDNRLSDALSVEGDLQGALSEAALMDTSVTGPLTVSAADVSRADRLLQAAGVSIPPWAALDGGVLQSRVQLDGTLRQPRASGEASVSGLRIGGSAPLALDGSFVAGTRVVALSNVHAMLGANVADGAAELNLASGALRGAFDVGIPDASSLGNAVARWRPAGQLTGRVELGGTRTNPAVQVTASGQSLGLAGQSLGTAALALSYTDGIAGISRFQLEQPTGGRLQATGTYESGSGRHQLNLQAQSFAVSPITTGGDTLPFQTTIDGTLQTSGTLEQPAGGGRLVLTDASWGDARIDRAEADVELSEAGVSATVRAPTLSLLVKALVKPASPYGFTLDATADGTSIQELVRALGAELPPSVPQVTGTASARLEASGSLENMADATADLRLTTLELRSDDASLRLASPAAARYEASVLTVESLRLATGQTTLELSGEIARTGTSPGVSLAINGDIADVEPWLALAGAPAGLTVGGEISATLLASGSLETADLTGRLQVDRGRVEWPGYPAATEIGLRAAIQDDAIDVTDLTGTWQLAMARGRARVPLGLLAPWLPAPLAAGVSGSATSAALTATIDNLTPAALTPFAGTAVEDTLTGRASVVVDVTADAPSVDRLNGTLLLREFDFATEGLPIVQERPTRVNIVQGELQIADWSWTVAGSRVQVGGRAQLAGDQVLDLTVGGQLDLRVVRAFVPDVSTGGVGDLSVAVRGTLGAPLAEGSVQLRDGELAIADPQIGISDARGTILLRSNRLEVSGLEGDLNGGRFAVIGGLEYRGLSITGGALSIESKGLALDVPAGMRTEVDAAIAVAFGNRIQVSGRVDVVRGAYREPLSVAVGLATATRDRAAAAGGGEASWLEQVDLNVAVASASDLVIDNNYGRMDLGLDVRLVGTAAQPSIVGRAIIRDGGTLFLGGRSYLIERGVIDFTNPRAIVPELDLLARTRLRGPDEGGQGTEYDISLELRGTPENLEATLSSDPARSQVDIISLLATGRLADQAGGIGGAAATEQAIGLLSGEALGFAAQAIGVDSLRIERDPALDAFAANPAIAAEVNPAQRLTVTRRITDVEVTLSQNLRDAGLFTWIVSYAPIRAIELRTLARDDRSRSYEMRHDLSFGGVGRPTPARDPAGRDAGRVASVRLTGDLRYPVEEVQSTLHLETGDRFDFYRWQEDRDRLRRFYLDRRHLEVRITARRVDRAATGDGTGVGLEYDIQAGPLTNLEITGHPLPGGVIRELEGIWSNNIVQVALVADLRSAVRGHMVEQGYLRPEIQVEQSPSNDSDKRVRIAITPGPRVSLRRVEFAGNERLSTAVLQQAAVRLGAEIWLTPTNLADEVARLYREEGLLAAKVIAGPVSVKGDEATLPVRIEEGPQFRVARVVVSGAKARSETDVRADLNLEPDAPYTPAAVQQARVAVGRGYDASGFTSMTSTVETVTDAATATVEVRLAIDEGPQQILDAITVTGADDVPPGVISDALALSTGTPVDMDAWYAGRRRLFRTGLFQRVDVEPVPVEGPAPPGIMPVRAQVTLVRRPLYRLRYGVDVTDEAAPLADQGRVFGAGVSANLERYGLFGRAGTVGTGLRVNNDQRIARGFLTLPYFLGREVTSRLFAARSREFVEGADILSFVVDKTAFTAEQRFRVWNNVEFAYGYQFERNHTFDPNADLDDPFALDNRVQAARLTATVVFDTRTDAFAPTSGWFHSSTVEYAPERLGSDARFAKYSLQQYFFAQVAPRVVSASALRIGIGRGFGQRLLITERFLSGGANTVRGYPTDALGGYDFFGDPIRGEAVVVLNQEVRFPIFRWVSGAGFVDAGEVFERPADVSLRMLDVGIGGGLRFSTPVGLFRLDLATPAPRRERPLQWYFAFGHTF